MTKQEIIVKINADFKGKARNNNRCAYLTGDGKKCAIGLFIPDGHKGQFHTGTVIELLNDFPDLKPHMPSQNLDFLRDLQRHHDTYLGIGMPLEDQKEALMSFVQEYKGAV